ncbi:hypothetical protein KMI_09g14650 [Encephalitozoon hellem]|nr:hypothetical protein KMI_09g14650 [Encephalitozoon hellem]
MKNQRTVFLLGCITTGIVMVLFGIDFMMPRSSVRSAGLVERGRMSLFGKKTSAIGKFAERKSNDRIDVLREKMDLIGKKLDRVIKIVEEIKSANKADSTTMGKSPSESEGTYHESRYSYRPERSLTSPMLLGAQPYYLGERGQGTNIDAAESPRKSHQLGGILDAFHPEHSDGFALHASGSGSYSVPSTDKPSVPKEAESKLEPQPSLSSSGEVMSPGLPESIAIGSTLGNPISGGERIEKLIGEFLNESFTNAIKPSLVIPAEDTKELQEKPKDLKESKSPNGSGKPSSADNSASEKPLDTHEKRSAYAKKDTQESKVDSSSSLDKKAAKGVSKGTLPVNSGSQKSDSTEAKPLLGSVSKSMNETGKQPGYKSLHSSDRSRGSILYPSESEISYEDASSSGADEEGAILRNRVHVPKISVIKL